MIWLTLLIVGFIFYLFNPDFFTKEAFSNWLGNNQQLLGAVYLMLILLRALFFIPSTIVLLLGIALYPKDPTYVITINLLGILVGAFFLYTAAQHFTPDKIFSDSKQEKFEAIQEKLRKYGFWIVMVWSFIPIVPTDLICYISGAVEMNKAKFYSAILIGEFILVCLYVYTGQGLIEFLF